MSFVNLFCSLVDTSSWNEKEHGRLIRLTRLTVTSRDGEQVIGNDDFRQVQRVQELLVGGYSFPLAYQSKDRSEAQPKTLLAASDLC